MVLQCFITLKICVLLYACKSVHVQSCLANLCVYSVSVSVCTQHRSETGWTTAAVEGTGKESRGKGVTAACRPPNPLPIPKGAIKHPQDNFTQMHTHKQGDHNNKVHS